MAADKNAFEAYSAIGNREDLSNLISMISPTNTPFMSGIPSNIATAVLHEWQTDALADAADNAVEEGAAATGQSATATTRLTNRTQISRKVPAVTGTQEAVDSAGRASEMGHQIAKRAKELKRDIETGLLKNVAKVTGSSGTAALSAGVPTWIATNQDKAGDGSAPAGTGADTRTDGTRRVFTETQVKAVLQGCYDEGGDPDRMLVGTWNKQVASTFTGNATRNIGAQDKELIATIDIYVSDFGTIEVLPSRFQRSRDALVLQSDLWAHSKLRPFRLTNLSKGGDVDWKLLLCEWTLEARNEAGNGIIADLLTA